MSSLAGTLEAAENLLWNIQENSDAQPGIFSKVNSASSL